MKQFRKAQIKPLPPITWDDYSFFPPNKHKYKQQGTLIQRWNNSFEYRSLSQDDSGSDSSQGDSSCSMNPLNQVTQFSQSTSQRLSNCLHQQDNSRFSRTHQQSVRKQRLGTYLSESIAKYELVYSYLRTAPLSNKLIYSSKIMDQLSSEQFLNSHSLQQIRKQLDSLKRKNVREPQQSVGMQQARGAILEMTTDAEMLRMESKLKQLGEAMKDSIKK